VLDTWFSSGLFPFSTLGWPNTEAPDFKAFYPNSVLETGHDILFFWVARMVMMGLQLTGQLPFHTVYLHAMVRDKYGRKMSKSLGNVIDPMDVIHGIELEALHVKVREGNLNPLEVEKAIQGQKLDYPSGIPECGADALRLGLLKYTVQGRDINLDVDQIVSLRQFCNKLWQATFFVLMHLKDYEHTGTMTDMIAELSAETVAPREQWMLSRLSWTVAHVNTSLAEYGFSAACSALYDLFQKDLCDYYIEMAKPVFSSTDPTVKRQAKQTLLLTLELGLRMLHPMMPFVTEELWQRLPSRGHKWSATVADPPSICVAAFPTPLPQLSRPALEDQFTYVQTVVKKGRSVKDAAQIKSAVPFVIATSTPALLGPFHADMASLMGSNDLVIQASAPADAAKYTASVVDDSTSVYMLLPAKDAVDFTVQLARADKQIEETRKRIKSMELKIAEAQPSEKSDDKVKEKLESLRRSLSEKLAALVKELEAQLAAREQLVKMM